MGIFRSKKDDETEYSSYHEYDNFNKEKHTHRFGGYTKDGRYYEGGHGENVTDDEKKNAGRILRKARGDDDNDDDD